MSETTAPLKQHNYLYLGRGFLPSQILWISHVLVAFIEQRSIHHVVCQDDLSHLVESLLPSHIKVIPESNIYQCKKSSTYTYLITKIPAILYYTLTISRKRLLDKGKSRYSSNLLHAIWDNALLRSVGGCIQPSLINIFISVCQCLLAQQRAKRLCAIGVNVAFLCHRTYDSRAFKLILESFDVDILYQAGSTLFRPNGTEFCHKHLSKEQWRAIIYSQDTDTFEDSTQRRLLGQSNYPDATHAASLTSDPLYVCSPNQIFLHVFRDSPFYILDRQRIFADYVDWTYTTLKILSRSSENWDLRVHPSSERWGEKTSDFLDRIISKVFPSGLPQNIRLIINPSSNIEVLNQSTRIVTYSGHVATEAAAFGLKPITISVTAIESFSHELVNKPDSISQYEHYLLCPSNSRCFKLTDSARQSARRVLFALENQLTMRSELAHITTYRGDQHKCFTRDFYSVQNNLESNPLLKSYLYSQGIDLATFRTDRLIRS